MSNTILTDTISLIPPIKILTEGSPKPIRKRKKKNRALPRINDEDFIIPTFDDYELILTQNYNVKHLKEICRHYKQKISGNKDELKTRIYNYLHLSCSARIIQRVWRKHIRVEYNKMHGPARNNRKLCVNETDFFNMEPIKNIASKQFFSYKDGDDMIYGFDILSLYNLLTKRNGLLNYTNPYNRNVFPQSVRRDIDKLLRLSRMIGEKIVIKIEEEQHICPTKQMELRSLALFQDIDNLGNYTNPMWFWSLEHYRIIRLIRELGDIWMYRAQLLLQTKKEICPPVGDPFRGINTHSLVNLSLDKVRKVALKIMEKLVRRGINNASKSLGANYVLCALTLVNNDAAMALPWLYQSVAPLD